MNEIVLILKDHKNNRLVYVQFDQRLSLLDNLFILNDLKRLFSFPLRIYSKGINLDLNVPLNQMDLMDGQRLEVYCN